MRRTTTMLLVMAILSLVAMPAAWAEDDPKGDSGAEQAFRDAWWAETSAGALDRALDGYRKALDLEGPAAVRANALYRSAVVLERIGKTADAIRALERLAKDYPDEADLQAKARDRLEEWTAVDLRTNFEAWYERYKYSPEFQGRIVELVLRLGASSGDQAGANSAAEELLIIGEASVPALQAHLDSPNEKLRDRAVDLLLHLGTYPHVRHLLTTKHWSLMPRGWSKLLATPPEVRTRMLSELDALGDDGEAAAQLRSILQGHDGWTRALEIDPNRYLIPAILDADPSEAVVEALRKLVSKLEPRAGSTLAHYLFEAGQVPNATALGWLSLPEIRDRVVDQIWRGSLNDQGAWRALVQAMNDLPIDDPAQRQLFQALMRSLADAYAGDDLRPAVLAYERVAPSGNVRLSLNQRSSTGAFSGSFETPDKFKAASRFLSRVVDEARDPKIAYEALQVWARLHRGDDDVSHRLIAWAQYETSPEVSLPAAKLAGSMVTDATLDSLLKALGSRTPAVDTELLGGLRRNRMLHSLTWGDERFLRLNAFARASSAKADVNLDQELNRLFRELHKLPERIDQTTRLALKVPQRVWTGVTRNTDKSTLPFFQRPEYLESVRSGFRTKWPHWPLEDRIAALSLFTNLPAPIFEDEELVTFLREELGRQWAVKGDVENEDLEQEGKQRILRLLPEVDLADVRKVYDLSTSAGALAAWASHRLPFTAEVYEALSAARKVDDYEARYGFLNHWMRKAPDEIGYRVATEMASDPDELVRRVGLQHLAQRRSMDDVRVFEKALSDADDEVRFVAAEALAGVYDQAAIQALAKALDDPDPEVRDRVLQTLEAIRTVEEKKDYWRGFAEGKR